MREELQLLEQQKWNAHTRYAQLTTQYMDKEAKLEAFVQKWLNNESELSDASMQQLLDTTNAQIEELKKQAQLADEEFKRLSKEEALKSNALSSVKNNFGLNPDGLIITGGVLSSNASESHLNARTKTPEELEMERQSALAIIRERVAKNQITLAEASKLKNDIDIAYGFNSQSVENRAGMSK